MFRGALRSTLTVGVAALCLIGCDKRIEQAQEAAEQEGAPTQEGACDAECGELNYSCCDQRIDCQTVMGAHVESDMACVVSNAFAGCLPDSRQCDQTMTVAVSPSGECWKLLNSCVPGGDWKTASGDEKSDCQEELSEVDPC